MSFMESVKTCFTKIVTFEGRARRSEYWYFALCVWIISILVSLILNNTGVVAYVISIVLSLASLSAEVRRLHDIGKSGWFVLLELIPLVGFIIILIWLCKDSEPGENKYGPNPKEGAA